MSFNLITAALLLTMPQSQPVQEAPPADKSMKVQPPQQSKAPEADDAAASSTAIPRTEPDTAAAEDEAAAAADDVVVLGRRPSSTDPLERVNEQSFKAIQAVDGAVVAPLARGYKKGVPKSVRRGIHNFLDNVQEPIVFLNYLLQLKPGKAVETLGRFAINTTVGIAGVVDGATKKPFNLPHRPNSLANTLGYHGVGPGPYLFLPLIGPTTVRDLFGTAADRLVLPTTVGAPFNRSYYAIPTNVLSALDYRVAFDETLTELHNASDPYAATRKNYLARRKAEIDRLHSPKWRARHSATAPSQTIGNALPLAPLRPSNQLAAGTLRHMEVSAACSSSPGASVAMDHC